MRQLYKQPGTNREKMKQIFLVEDDKAIAKNLTLLLQAEGYGVSHASGQAEAAAMLERARYDLALVDVSLPDGNGFAVCTWIRQRSEEHTSELQSQR